MQEICKICRELFVLMLELCQFRVLTNAASSHVRLPLVTVAGRFTNDSFR